MVEQVGSPGLTYMLDTIHLNIEERSVVETIRVHGGRIRHFHLCETNGGMFGTGNLDFQAVLRTLAETGYPHFASVKIYRDPDWEEAARGAVTFLAEKLPKRPRSGAGDDSSAYGGLKEGRGKLSK